MLSVFMALGVAALAGCSFEPEKKIWEIAGPVFGTQYHINVVLTDNEARLETLGSGIEQVLEDVDASMPSWRSPRRLRRLLVSVLPW